MTEHSNLRTPTIPFDHKSTLVAVMELSNRSWMVGATVPGIERRPLRKLTPRDIEGVLDMLKSLKEESARVGETITRVVVCYEAGRDGFWIARELASHGIEAYVVQPSSIPVERRFRRSKTDRIDVDLLLRTLLAWLRGEPRVCSMVPIPTVAEEDVRRPNRERETLVVERLAIENRIGSILTRFGLDRFNPQSRNTSERLDALRDRQGAPLPVHTAAELRRLIERHGLIMRQIKTVEAELEALATNPAAGELGEMLRLLIRIPGIAVGTATLLMFECLTRHFANSKALGAFAGLTGSPYDSGGSQREQGISKNGSSRLRRCLIQLAWRWLHLNPDNVLSRWYIERTAGAVKGRIRKILIVALARKLLVALWKMVRTGVVPADIHLKPA